MSYLEVAQIKKALALPDSETAWKPADNGLLAAAFNPTNATGQVVLPGAGVPVFVRVRVPAGVIITNIVTYVTVVAASQTYSAAAVYEADGTRTGVTGSQITAWRSVGLKTMPLGTPIAAQATSRFVYVGLLSEGGTAPTLGVASGILSASWGMSAAPYAAGYGFAAAPLPSSFTLTGTAEWYHYWVGLS